jgi:hypothetical protein
MKLPIRTAVLAVLAVGLLTFPLAAAADHATRPHTANIQALGHSPDFGSFLLPDGQRDANSDLAFWGNLAFHGDYDGFRIIDISDPNNPQLVSRTRCNGDQGDIVVWEDVLVRSWNAPKTAPRSCDGTTVPPGFEGVHIFDISNLADPVLVGEVELSARPEADAPGCGSHTATLVPDLADNRLLIYNATSGGNRALQGKLRDCDWLDVLQVPLANPGAATHLHREPLEGQHAAHDSGVILGNVNLLAVASGHMANVFSIGSPRGGTPENPRFLYGIEERGVRKIGNWHSAALTWDGEVIVLGWEPGGGSQPMCEETDPPVRKSMFFYKADTGAKLGQWTLPRPQSAEENCTIHNYNIVPLTSGRYIAVGGHYQAGTWVTDFTNPAIPVTVAWSDPPPLVPTQLGGAWSSYWYNGLIYESEISKGLNVFSVSDPRLAGAISLPHLNPQTQEFSIP